jgi:hypothetical protein
LTCEEIRFCFPCDPCNPRNATVNADLSGSARTGYSFPSSTAPTSSYNYNGEDPLYTGSFYYNTSSGSIYVWNGSNWSSGFGSSGTSGTSGTGFNTINNSAIGRVLISDGSVNAATASSDLTFSGNKLIVTGSIDISGSIFQHGIPITLPSVYTQSIGNNSNQSFTINHNLNSILVSVHMLNSTSTQIYYPTQQTASLVRGSFHAFISGSNTVVVNTPYVPTTNEFLIVVKT